MVTDADREALARNSANQLRAYINKMTGLDVEIAKLNKVKSTILAEARACGFSKQIIKTALRRQRQSLEERQSDEELLLIYEGIMSGAIELDPLRM